MPDNAKQFTLVDGTRIDSLTDWDRLAKMTDEEVLAAALSDPDAQPLTDGQLARMVPFRDTEVFKRIHKRAHENKQSLTVRYDADVVRFYRSQGKGYQRLMNDVLRAYMEGVQGRVTA